MFKVNGEISLHSLFTNVCPLKVLIQEYQNPQCTKWRKYHSPMLLYCHWKYFCKEECKVEDDLVRTIGVTDTASGIQK